ncbi:MAG TPA: hypothetical protein EYO33_29200, partial [Phycisphaerales bacterium]|nr:hypothetical protein [Phycisphaerales bacterium]
MSLSASSSFLIFSIAADSAQTPRENVFELLIPFHLELYLRHGLALEAHMQNCVVVWSEEGPEKLWVRDWGGLRADAEKLGRLAPDILTRLDHRSVSLSNAATAEKKLIACLYCNHLT